MTALPRTAVLAHALAAIAVATLVVAIGVKFALAPRNAADNIQVLLLTLSLLLVGWILAWKRPAAGRGGSAVRPFAVRRAEGGRIVRGAHPHGGGSVCRGR